MSTNRTNSNEAIKKTTLLIIGLAIISMWVFFVRFRANKPSIASTSEAKQQTVGKQNLRSKIAQLMKRLQKNPRDVSTLEKLGRMFMMMKSWKQAKHFWKRALKVKSDYTPARLQLARCFYQTQNFKKAARNLEKVIKSNPSNTQAHFNLGVLYKYYLDSRDNWKKHFKKVLQTPEVDQKIKKRAQEEIRSD